MNRLASALLMLVLAAGALLGARDAHAQFLFSTPSAQAGMLNQPVPAVLLAQLEQASQRGLGFVHAPQPPSLQSISGPLRGRPPVLLYVGADYCPYCAAQRWGLVLTLARFGTLSGLRYMLSSAHDVFPNTATFSLAQARLSSRVLHLAAYETADREEKPLMKLPPQAQAVFQQFDVPPHVQYAYGIPFVYLDGRFLMTQLMISPASLAGLNWQQIAAQLDDPHSALFAAIMPRVNLLTAAICSLNGGVPAHVCYAPGVRAAAPLLAHLPDAATPQGG